MDLDTFYPVPKHEAAAKVDFKRDKNHLLYVGNLIEEKRGNGSYQGFSPHPRKKRQDCSSSGRAAQTGFLPGRLKKKFYQII
ncbi:hypothetical protein [Sinobaca sp. H24]|uniref:hypothetical protein n=1 Tax=Sinobaca sp. H24 TaxID=2923376 RepID=UPI0020798AE5|nr:hypothetical protein [Sinobaca sp. H24]